MKQLNIVFEDEDYEKLIEAKEKSELGWREFLLSVVKENDLLKKRLKVPHRNSYSLAHSSVRTGKLAHGSVRTGGEK